MFHGSNMMFARHPISSSAMDIVAGYGTCQQRLVGGHGPSRLRRNVPASTELADEDGRSAKTDDSPVLNRLLCRILGETPPEPVDIDMENCLNHL